MVDVDFEPAEIIGVLARHRVKYVLIGGIAAVFHGSPHATFDMDIRPSTAGKNLERLVEALKELDARIRVADDGQGIPFEPSTDLFKRVEFLNLVTRFGAFDVCFKPAALGNYDELRERAVVVSVYGNQVPVASIEDLIRSKEAADRDKDHLHLPLLRRMLEEGEHLGSEA